MALASCSVGAHTVSLVGVPRNSFGDFERGNAASCYENRSRSNCSNSVNGSTRTHRNTRFSSSVTSSLFMKSFSHQIRTSVAYGNCTSRVSGGVVASLDDNGKPQKKMQPSVDDFFPEFDELTRDELQTYLNLELQSGLDLDTYKHYEIMFIVHEKNVNEVQAVIDKITGFVLENKGFIYRINDWGLRRLAYKIKKAEKGNYVLMNIEIGSDVINDLNTMFEQDERVIRHMVMSQKEAVSDDMEPPEEWRPSSASAEGGEAQEEDDEEYIDDEEDDEEEEEEDSEDEGQRNGELMLERQT